MKPRLTTQEPTLDPAAALTVAPNTAGRSPSLTFERIAFGIFEVLINLATGVTGALAPLYLAQGMAPPGVVAPDAPFTVFVVHAYAALITLLGLLEAVVMWRGDARVVRLAITCLLVGDCMHLAAWLPGFLQAPVWSSATIGTLGVIGTLIPLRLVALFRRST